MLFQVYFTVWYLLRILTTVEDERLERECLSFFSFNRVSLFCYLSPYDTLNVNAVVPKRLRKERNISQAGIYRPCTQGSYPFQTIFLMSSNLNMTPSKLKKLCFILLRKLSFSLFLTKENDKTDLIVSFLNIL